MYKLSSVLDACNKLHDKKSYHNSTAGYGLLEIIKLSNAYLFHQIQAYHQYVSGLPTLKSNNCLCIGYGDPSRINSILSLNNNNLIIASNPHNLLKYQKQLRLLNTKPSEYISYVNNHIVPDLSVYWSYVHYTGIIIEAPDLYV